MPCLNDCGNKYLKDVKEDYTQLLSKYTKEFDSIK